MSRILTTTELGFTEREDAELNKYSIWPYQIQDIDFFPPG